MTLREIASNQPLSQEEIAQLDTDLDCYADLILDYILNNLDEVLNHK